MDSIKTTKLKVDAETVIQDNFMGINAVYHGFNYMPEQLARGMNDFFRVKEYERLKAIRFHIARTMYRPDFACGSSLLNDFDWRAEKMEAFCKWCGDMKSLGIEVAINPWGVHQGGLGDVLMGGTTDRWMDFLPRFTEWLSESIHQLIEVRGLTNIKYLILFTEASSSWQTAPTPNGYTYWTWHKKCMQAVYERLKLDNRLRLIKLVGPNNCFAAEHLDKAVDECDDIIDIYSGHDYNLGGYKEWYAVAKKMADTVKHTGKAFWFDEYGKQAEDYRLTPDYGNYLAQANAAILNAGLQTSMIWLLADQYYVAPQDKTTNDDSFYDGQHKWGVWKWLPDSLTPYPSYYAFGLMSKYLGGQGTRLYKTCCSDDVFISASRQPDGIWSFLTVNGAEEERQIEVSISKPLNVSLFRHMYDPAAIKPDENAGVIAADKVFDRVAGGFSDVIPAKAVVVFTSDIT